ncbi:AI-2E family transporter [Bacteroidia bacterium]|nr:AI-2E family transporter [Bacteroidia bacterium]
MNKLARYIVVISVTAAVLFIVWYFQNIVGYVLAALALSFIGKPMMRMLTHIRIKQHKLPRAVCAIITIIALWGVFFGFFSFFIPLIAEQINTFSAIDTSHLATAFDNYFHRTSVYLQRFTNASLDYASIKDKIVQELARIFDDNRISIVVTSLFETLKGIAIAAFAITFITFFFLKEDGVFFNFVTLLFPKHYEENITRVLTSVNQLLVRYFVGIFCDMLCMLTLLSLGLTFIAGFPLQQAMLIGLIAGILNVIPYVGPLVGLSISLLFALTASLHTGVDFGVLALKTAIVFLTAQITDMAFLQPYIYANSIKSHPLEIFLVILIAGSLAGITGMLVAIPTYTILRVFAKEFFNHFRVVQKLTEKI